MFCKFRTLAVDVERKQLHKQIILKKKKDYGMRERSGKYLPGQTLVLGLLWELCWRMVEGRRNTHAHDHLTEYPPPMGTLDSSVRVFPT